MLTLVGGVGRVGGLVLVERIPCLAWVRWSLEVSSQLGQYFEVLE